MFRIAILLCAAALCEGWSDTRTRQFPKDFLFGAATAAHLVEDKGDNSRDNTQDISSNSYHNYKQDVKLLRKMGAKFYKFSLSWSRILPNGTPDEIDEGGIEYYSNLIDELLRNRIQPMVTLYHDDLPQRLRENGGWTNGSIVEAFVDFSRIVFENYGSRVKLWVTVNNPFQVCQRGYGLGDFDPIAVKKGVDEYVCARNILLAHAGVWHLYDKEYRSKNVGKLGISINVDWMEALSNDTKHVKGVEEARQFYFGLYAHPIFSKSGDFPKAVKYAVARKSKGQGLSESRLPSLSSKEIDLIHGSSDFFGLSHFTTHLVYRNASSDGSHEAPSFDDDVNVGLTASEEWARSSCDWLRSAPFGIYKALIWLNLNYDYPEVIVTELGWCSAGGLRDDDRASYLRGYFDALLIGMEDGARVAGLAVWSLVDGVERTAKFGLHEVDNSPERTRTPRKSALVYQEIIRSRTVDHSYEPGSEKVHLARQPPKQEL